LYALLISPMSDDGDYAMIYNRWDGTDNTCIWAVHFI